MTNREKFTEVFGEELQRQYATKSWWEQEYASPTLNVKYDVLDKIRAEIMSKDGLEEALEIIDKYRAESEK